MKAGRIIITTWEIRRVREVVHLWNYLHLTNYRPNKLITILGLIKTLHMPKYYYTNWKHVQTSTPIIFTLFLFWINKQIPIHKGCIHICRKMSCVAFYHAIVISAFIYLCIHWNLDFDQGLLYFCRKFKILRKNKKSKHKQILSIGNKLKIKRPLDISG